MAYHFGAFVPADDIGGLGGGQSIREIGEEGSGGGAVALGVANGGTHGVDLAGDDDLGPVATVGCVGEDAVLTEAGGIRSTK